MIVVQAERLRGQLDVEQAPIVEYSAEDIAAFGAGSITELVEQLEPVTGSSRGRGGGRPVFLINGVRVGSFRAFRSYPPEAIEKVEVFPEEVAQRFGYSPDQRVVNIILKDNYSSQEVELEYEQPAEGGFSRNEQEFTVLQITGGGRLNASFEARDTSLLTESERDLALVAGGTSDVEGDPNPLAFRSLVADSSSLEGTLNYAKGFVDSGASISLNLTAERDESRSLSGLDTVALVAPDGSSAFRTFNAADPLERNTRTDTLASSGSFSKPLGGFQLTATADAAWASTRTLIDRRADTDALEALAAAGALALDAPIPALPDAGRDEARSNTYTIDSLATLVGELVALPAGDVSVTFDAGAKWNGIDSRDSRGSGAEASLDRRRLNAGVNLAVPLTDRDADVLGAVGDVSLNFNAGVDHLSDFGTLYDWTVGAIWEPFDNLNLSATRIWREVAPSLTALGAPQVREFNVPVFDFATGQSVLATVITGGNPALAAETQADWKYAVNWELPFWDNTRFQLDYAVNRSDDVTLNAPAFTAAFEAAFPGRVTRAADGTLLEIDRRPVTLFETRYKVLSFGLQTRGRIGPEPEPRERGEGGERRGGGPRTMFGGGGEDRDTRPSYFASLNHSINLESEVLLSENGPLLDQLDGFVISGGALPEHSTRLEAGLFLQGIGLRLSGNYVGEAVLRGGDAPGASDLFFGDLATFDLRLFGDLGEVFDKEDGWLENLRLSLSADNIFDARRRVVDASGETPFAFQPFRIDSTGRYLGIELRKLF